MGRPELECDIETIFYCPEEENALLKRLSTHLKNIQRKTANFFVEELNNHRETSNKLEQNAELVTQLSNESKDMETTLENLLLEQKILAKKITNSINAAETLKEDIAREKAQKEALSLEMVDLQQELEKQKEAKKKEWNAIKKALTVYKEKLNIYIDVEHQDNCDDLKVAFFYHENPNRDNYYVILQHSNDIWKVCNIQPPLKDKYLKEIKLDFSVNYEISDIIRFLCQIRRIFLKHYFNHKQ